MKRAVQLAICAVGLGTAAELSAQDAPPVDGVATNDAQPLVFKRRPRRHYDSFVTIDGKSETLSVPASDERRIADEMPDVSSRIDHGFLRPGASPPPSGPMQPQRRMGRKADKEDDEWKLTPQERIQREIDKLSGKSEDEEDEENEPSGYGWLADEIRSIREEESQEAETRQRLADEAKEAEMIAAIIGRDLPGSIREDERPASPQAARSIPQTTPQGASSVAGFASSAESRPGTQASAMRRLSDEDLREMARRAVEESEKQARAASAAGAHDTVKGAAPATAAHRPGEGVSGAPKLFKWGESSVGGFAGLPSSLAPSIAPRPVAPSGAIGGGAFDPSARPTSLSSLPKPPALIPSSGMGWAGGPPSSRPWDAPRAPVGIQPREIRSPGGFDAPRSPFLNPMVPSSVQPSFSVRPGVSP